MEDTAKGDLGKMLAAYDRNEAAMLKRLEAILARADSPEMHARNAATEVMDTFLRGDPAARSEAGE